MLWRYHRVCHHAASTPGHSLLAALEYCAVCKTGLNATVPHAAKLKGSVAGYRVEIDSEAGWEALRRGRGTG